MEWDSFQTDVITAPPEQRLLVSAGPGTGKTAVACARIAHLIGRCSLEPGHIWLVSFTRTAVRELRDRISTYLGDPGQANSVTIATLDSHAWAIHSGFDQTAQILGSYDENIEKTVDLLCQREDLSDYLEDVEHLVVDEAQDIVGVRAELMLAIIERLSQECGATIFADEAQAIYGFAEDEDVRTLGERRPTLPERVRAAQDSGFIDWELQTVHRTSSPTLLTIFTDVRDRVLEATDDAAEKLKRTRNDVTTLCDGTVPGIEEQQLVDAGFVLYRRRAEVLLASSFLTPRPHRIRMSGVPTSIAAWVGAALGEYRRPTLDRETFVSLWGDHVSRTGLDTCSCDEAWERLVAIAGRTHLVVDMRLLRQRLGRGQPPAEICTGEVGATGPILGTIHACKGREADVVHLMLPRSTGGGIDLEEEARVVFVGATRARKLLRCGTGYAQFSDRTESGRVYSLKASDGSPRAQVEIGRDGDVSALGLAGRQYFSTPGQVFESQREVKGLVGKVTAAIAVRDKSIGWAYRVMQQEYGRTVAILSQQAVNQDLFEIGRAIQREIGGERRSTPKMLKNLRLVGVRTIVVSPDRADLEQLHWPWNQSGILLAPVVVGYTTPFFPRMHDGSGHS